LIQRPSVAEGLFIVVGAFTVDQSGTAEIPEEGSIGVGVRSPFYLPHRCELVATIHHAP